MSEIPKYKTTRHSYCNPSSLSSFVEVINILFSRQVYVGVRFGVLDNLSGLLNEDQVRLMIPKHPERITVDTRERFH